MLLTLTSVTGGAVLWTPSVATVLIMSNVVATVSATTPTANESWPVPGVFTVALSQPATATTTVTYALSGTAASSEYTPSSTSSVLFSIGHSTADVVISPNQSAG